MRYPSNQLPIFVPKQSEQGNIGLLPGTAIIGIEVLNEEQVHKYEETGFLFIQSFVKKEWLSDLKDITYKMIHVLTYN